MENFNFQKMTSGKIFLLVSVKIDESKVLTFNIKGETESGMGIMRLFVGFLNSWR